MATPLTLTNPLSSVTERLLHSINRVCNAQAVPFFIAGATAREILIHHVYGKTIGRRTRDIDFAVFVNSWAPFDALKQAFIDEGAQAVTGNAHRMTLEGVELDIIPFGGVAEGKHVAWPPDRDVIMAVDGFEEAYHHTVRVALAGGEAISFCSLPGLALLKLFAWRDRGAANGKDAADLYKIISDYGAIEEDRIYEPPVDGPRLAWDPARMGAFLLGSDLAAISAGEALADITRLDRERLTDAVVRQLHAVDAGEIDQMMTDFWQGVEAAP